MGKYDVTTEFLLVLFFVMNASLLGVLLYLLHNMSKIQNSACKSMDVWQFFWSVYPGHNEQLLIIAVTTGSWTKKHKRGGKPDCPSHKMRFHLQAFHEEWISRELTWIPSLSVEPSEGWDVWCNGFLVFLCLHYHKNVERLGVFIFLDLACSDTRRKD